MEKYIWSLDISTTNIGSALWDSNGKLIELKHLALKLAKNTTIEDRDILKAEIFKNYVLEFKERLFEELNGEIGHLIVEEPLGGSNNPSTASLLYGFNGICRYILFEIFGIYPMKISVHESRKLFCNELVKISYTRKGEKKETLSFPVEYRKLKKLYIWEKVSKLEPQIDWFYKRDKPTEPRDICFDMSDSYAVGYAGLKILNIIK